MLLWIIAFLAYVTAIAIAQVLRLSKSRPKAMSVAVLVALLLSPWPMTSSSFSSTLLVADFGVSIYHFSPSALSAAPGFAVENWFIALCSFLVVAQITYLLVMRLGRNVEKETISLA